MVKTIKDIAQAAGISVATVSRVLNRKEGMSAETRERVLKTAKLLNYHPNLRARGLVKKGVDIIEIVIPQTSEFAFSNPYYSEILKGIAKKTKESEKYLLLSFSAQESYAKLYQHGLSAGIIVLANRTDDHWIEEARKMKIPMVLIPGYPDGKYLPSVDWDNIDGAFKAVNYLVEIGHRRIGFLTGRPNSKYSIERLEGYRRALEKSSIKFREELIIEMNFTQEGGYEGMKRLLSISGLPTAVLVINDYSAIGALRAVKEGGYRVPEDVSIVSFGDTILASMTDPALTTVREPYQELGYEATAMLIRIIDGRRLAKRHVVFPVELIVRNSTCPFMDKQG
jgi:LacI family transcriptional regulator